MERQGTTMRDQDVLRAATMYYVQDETMDSIAHMLGTSRSTVSRLLKRARESGIVRVTIQDPENPGKVGQALQRMFGIRVHLVTVREGASDVFRLEQVAKVSAQLLVNSVKAGTTLGVAWGTTVSAIANQLVPTPVPGVTVVGMNGGANQTTSGIPYVGSIYTRFADTFGGHVIHLPMPAFFDFPSTREAMWRERSIRAVQEVQSKIDIAIFGVGGIDSPLQSRVYSASYLDEDDITQLRAQGVVGDVCTVMLREDGSYADVAINARSTGLTPPQLRRIPRRFCVVSGLAKAAPILGALRARVATDLVIDEATARAVLEQL